MARSAAKGARKSQNWRYPSRENFNQTGIKNYAITQPPPLLELEVSVG